LAFLGGMAAVDIGAIEPAWLDPELRQYIGCRPRALVNPCDKGSGVGIKSLLGFGHQRRKPGIAMMLHIAAERVDAQELGAWKVVEEEQRRTSFPRADLQDSHRLVAQWSENLHPDREVPRRPVRG